MASVLLTRTRSGEPDPLASMLAEAGIELIYCPTIKIVPPESYDGLDTALRNLDSYDWALFTSRNAVASCVERLKHLELRFSDRIEVLAVGRSTAERLQSTGIRVSLVPREFNADAAVEALSERLGSVAGLRFFFPRAARGRPTLVERLREMGAEVDLVEAYRTLIAEESRASIERLFAENAPSVAVFASPSAVQSLAEMLAPRPLSEALKGTLIASIGTVTTNAIVEAGLSVDIQPIEATAEMLGRAIIERLRG